MESTRFTGADVTLQPYPPAPERLTEGAEISAASLWQRDDGSEIGAVWQMTPGTLTGVQGNEAFVLLSGHARVEFSDGRVWELRAGDGAFIAPGDTCTWTTIETVRKITVARLT
jgi:uncharacterized cupin superfamily protein